MNTKITDFSTLRQLVELDPEEHAIKRMAQLFVNAMRDWPTDTNDLAACVLEYKAFFGDPLTIEGIKNAYYTSQTTHIWWRLETSIQLFQLLKIATEDTNTFDFDTAFYNIISYYSAKI